MKTGSIFRIVARDPLQWLAFGFGTGLSPIAPGTWGTLIGVLVYCLVLQSLLLSPYLVVVLFSAAFGIWLCRYSAKRLNVHDHPGIVWDEIVGFWVTMIGVPSDAKYLLLGFLLFRFLDIWKPWPISWLDKSVSGGLGIMLDDLLAGALACLLLHGIIQLWS